MKAAIREEYGGPEVLAVRNVPVPEPGRGEVLVRVMATTVNRTDCAVLTGKPAIMKLFTGLRRPSIPVTGTDFSGLVEASNADGIHQGDRVFGFLDTGLPSHAEFLAVHAKHVRRMPDVSFEEAAASCEAAHYARHFLQAVNVKRGQKALVNGAGGGIGSALLQFLIAEGVLVTAVCRTDQVERVRALGADRIIDYENDEFTACGDAFDFVFDAVGKSRFSLCRRIMKPASAYLSSELGPRGENLWLPLLTRFSSQRAIFPFPSDIPESLRFVSEMLESGKFKPLIDRTYDLEQIAEAFRYAASGQKTGNVIVRIDS